MKIAFYIFFVTVVSFCSCSVNYRANHGRIMVYEIFDSLNAYLSEEIARKGEPKGVIIDVACKGCIENSVNDIRKWRRENNSNYKFQGYQPTEMIYGFGLVYSFEGIESQRKIFKTSTRYLYLNKRFYPVYMLYADNDFVKSVADKQQNSSIDSARINPRLNFPDVNFVVADMLVKVYFTPTALRGVNYKTELKEY